MSAPVAVAACLCALSVFVATGLDRADARKIAGACKREAVLVAAAGRSVVDAVTARVKGAVGAGGPARVSLGEVSEMIDVVRLGLSAGLSFDAALEIFCANRRSVLALRLERACMAWQVGVGTREDELLAVGRAVGRHAATWTCERSRPLPSRWGRRSPWVPTCRDAGRSKSRDPCGSSRRGRARDRACARQAADSHRHAHLAGVASVHIGPAAGSRRDDVGRNT